MSYKIAVAGTGYVGLVTGVCLAHTGHQVTCVDLDEGKIKLLKSGKSPIYEEGLEELMIKNAHRLSYTTDYASAYRDADMIFIGVGTPERVDGSANLSFVYGVVSQIARHVEKDCVVVVKSTVPIGTNDKIEALLKRELAHPVSVEVASNPEFLSQGTAVRDTLHASRIVLGVESPRAERILREVYAGYEGVPVVTTNRRSAEMIKYASNDFLALKISYINEIANLCEIVGADVTQVAEAMGLDNRIGNKFLQAGIGYGGSCFPKDTKALHWLANYYDYEMKTVKAAIEVNELQKTKLLKKARKYYDSFEGLRVAVLGLTFKPGTDDLRDAPSLQNIPALLEDGANVYAWDPIGMENFKKRNLGSIHFTAGPEEALEQADLCLILTEWPQIRALTASAFLRMMKRPIVLDGRNCYPLHKMEESGVIYESIGRRTV
jgi:UDPglucose 6-dehydrogenase